MGSWFSKPKCKYRRGWKKSNACPPGFKVRESCGRWSSTISCRAPTRGFSDDAVPVSAQNGRIGGCTSDSTHPNNGGAKPSSASCAGSDIKVASSYVACCSGASTCKSSNTVGWAERAQCAKKNGDYVFDVSSPDGCRMKQEQGLSNNFPAQSWCKKSGSGTDACWLPYSMRADGKCFAYGDMQWNSATDRYGAKTKKGGSKILLNGGSNLVSPAAALDASTTTYNSGSIAGASAGGFACVVGVGALFRKKQQKRTAGKPADLELKGGANTV
ncbi:hypothetical protein TrCOL_g4014 [Triparma columacea]|uniref:Uncharacterized protein n=1 Tax=Triparma columacea TaxID=722753 RepID=A0A9W7LC77_9STRA|nr:hypothetical protein TrCOL_g4014 [Triparma columacea]